MGNRGARANQNVQYGDPYLNQYGAGYGYGAQPGLTGYDPYAGAAGYSITTPPMGVTVPWAVTQWTEYYVPTRGGRQRRPVIYIAAPLPVANPCPINPCINPCPINPCAGLGGLGGFGGGLQLGGGLPLGGGFGGLQLGGGFGGIPAGGFGAGLGYQALPMMTVAYGGGIPGVGGLGGLGGLGGFGGGLGGLGGGLGGLGGGLGGLGGGLGGLGGGLGGLGGGFGGLGGGLGGLGGGGLPLY